MHLSELGGLVDVWRAALPAVNSSGSQRLFGAKRSKYADEQLVQEVEEHLIGAWKER